MAKRTRHVLRTFTLASGESSARLMPGVVSMELDFVGAGTLVVTAEELRNSPVADLILLHGASQGLGDKAAGRDNAVALTRAETRKELWLAGEWNARGEKVGARPSTLALAIVAGLEAQGDTVDAARLARIREKLKDKAERDGAIANAAIALQYARIEEERAAARRKDLKAAAKGVKVEGF